MKAETHSASGEPASVNGVTVFRNKPRVIPCLRVMSKGNKRSVSGLLSLDGYGGSSLFAGGNVVAGFGDVRANTRAAATASA